MPWLDRIVLYAALAAIPSTAAMANPRCIAQYNADTPAVEAPSAIAHKGEKVQITQMRVNRRTGVASFCAHGDYCYPTSGLDLMTPCAISATPEPFMADDEEWLYYPE